MTNRLISATSIGVEITSSTDAALFGHRLVENFGGTYEGLDDNPYIVIFKPDPKTSIEKIRRFLKGRQSLFNQAVKTFVVHSDNQSDALRPEIGRNKQAIV